MEMYIGIGFVVITFLITFSGSIIDNLIKLFEKWKKVTFFS